MSVGSGSLGAEEAGPPTGRTGKTREAVEPETVLVGRCPPRAGVLQRREQHGQNFQLSGGASAFLCASENLTAIVLTVCVEPPQILLQKSTLGDRADEMEALLKRHDAFEKLLNSQDDKVRVLLVLVRPGLQNTRIHS